MRMVQSILDSSLIANKERGCIVFLIRIPIWEHGKLISSMEMAITFIAMEKSIRASSNKARKMEKEHTSINLALDMKENGRRIEKMVSVSITTPLEIDTRETG